MTDDTTTARIGHDTRDRLERAKLSDSESLDSVIQRLLDAWETSEDVDLHDLAERVDRIETHMEGIDA